MRRLIFCWVVLGLSACGGDDGGGSPLVDGECVYISTTHSYYDESACASQGEALECESYEIEDRSDAERNVFACVYEGCSADYDCSCSVDHDYDCDPFRKL